VAGLTERQTKVLSIIAKALDEYGVAPSYREIANQLNIRSTNAVSDHLKTLEAKGYIVRAHGAGKARSLRLTAIAEDLLGLNTDEDHGDTLGVPVVGRIAAGPMGLATEYIDERVHFDVSLLPPGNDTFILVVHGDSMIEDGIRDGDYLIVQKRKRARRGEIAVVMVDQEATVKRFYPEGDKIRLQPANSAMDPIYVDAKSGEVQVVGVSVGLFRRY